MGRPRGSLNKKTSIVMKKRRGRPKKVVEPNEVLPPSKVIKAKFLGYCKCSFMICTSELVSKFIFECPSCGKTARVKALKKENGNTRPLSKKEYLDGNINASYHEMLPLNDHQIDPEQLKVQDI